MDGPRTPTGVVLGVDVGTTATKVTAFGPDARRVAHAEHGYALLEPAPGRVVQDVDAILGAALDAIAGCVRAVAEAGARVEALACSTAMHGLVPLDARDRPLGPLLTWADTRAAAVADRLRREHPDLAARTGTPLHPMSPLAKIAWFAERDPGTFGAARRWVGLKELLLHALCGAWVVDHSVASGTGLLSLADRDWDREALAVAGIDASALATPVAPTTVLDGLTADAARRTGLDRDTPVVAGAGDGPLALLGVGAVAPGTAAVSIGTSGALRVAADRPATSPHVFSYLLAEDRWVVGGATNNGGVVLDWAGDALAPDLGETPQDALLALAAAVPAGSDGLLMLPQLLGERAPAWSGSPRGAYVGLTRAHGRGHLVRAALEGVCRQLALVLGAVREAGAPVGEVRATGGFARSPLWRRTLADVLGEPVGFPAGTEGSGLGAALLGAHALGRVASLDEAAALVRVAETVEPDPDAAALHAATLPTVRALHEALAPTFAALEDRRSPRSEHSAADAAPPD